MLDAFVAECDNVESNFSLVGSSLTFHYDEWIVNSGCAYHICPNREWFFNFEKLNGGGFSWATIAYAKHSR